VTIYPTDNSDAERLLRNADHAMYEAKQSGKNTFHVFDVKGSEQIERKNQAITELKSAICLKQFVLYYQPKIEMDSGQVVGFEALLRWNHPVRGTLRPADFLHQVDAYGFDFQIGEWVIDEALRQQSIWQSSGLSLPISVNIGARQLQQADFVARLSLLLKNYPLFIRNFLEIEVVETSALNDIRHVSNVIHECKRMGVLFAIDDFGTGYSSLTYLKNLPAGTLKIDQSFIRDMLSDRDDFAIVKGVIGLSKAFGRRVVAEGVESQEVAAVLMKLGCDYAQGYGIAKPMPADNVLGWAAMWNKEQQWGSNTSVLSTWACL
jgi:EAL domain-containing protein (putative c-di-GMP-specific phosphodiesterase class I)